MWSGAADKSAELLAALRAVLRSIAGRLLQALHIAHTACMCVEVVIRDFLGAVWLSLGADSKEGLGVNDNLGIAGEGSQALILSNLKP